MNRTICKVGAVLLVLAGAAPSLGSPRMEATVWRRSQTQRWDGKLVRELDSTGAASEVLENYGNHHVEIAHRSRTGNAELHETQNDVFFILSGEATLVSGGHLVKPKRTEPQELEGTSISGGATSKLTAGDIVHIPSKVPHQLVLEDGKQLSYFVVKISAQ